MRSWCAGEFVSALDFRETFIPGPCLSNCSFYPKEQDLALSHAEYGLAATQGAGTGVGVQIQWSAPDYLWQLCTVLVDCPLHRHTKIHCSAFLPLMLFSWLSCYFCIKFISLGSSSNWIFLQRTTAFVPLSGEALGVCSTVCASSVRESCVQPVNLCQLGEAWSPLSAIS